MEAIRNYLETMFANLPNTMEVQKAKRELGQMMEDKYTELKGEGKTENEAIGTVISEFGNLDELAEDLGIAPYVKKQAAAMGKILPLQEVKEFLAAKSKSAFLVGLGVMLCILSPCAPILTDTFMGDGLANLGAALLFVLIGMAVALFVYAGLTTSKWEYLEKEPYIIDFATTEYVHNQQNLFRPTYGLMLTIGIVLCVLSVVPSILLENAVAWMEEFSGVLLFVMVGFGVFLIVFSCKRFNSFQYLLDLNKADTVAGNFVPGQNKNKRNYQNKTVNGIMSVYWPTITCIYLCWSFLTFDWHISWIIWPIAAVINALIRNICE